MANLNKTHVTCILDRSGSMTSLAAKTIEGFNGIVSERQHTTPSDKEVTLSLCLFDDQFDVIHNAVNVHEIPVLDGSVYYARGYTSLHDSLAKGIILTREAIAALPVEEQPGNVFIIIMTDGAENSSAEYAGEAGRLAIKGMIEELEGLHTKNEASPRWHTVFMGANIDAPAVAQTLGIRGGNSSNYSGTNEGTVAAYASVNAGLERSICIPSFESDFFVDNAVKIPDPVVAVKTKP